MKGMVLLVSVWSFTLFAAEQCIQSPTRTKACPHQLYRLGQLDTMTKPEILCICVADFAEYLTVPADKTKAEQQKLKRMQLESSMGRDIEPILKILRR